MSKPKLSAKRRQEEAADVRNIASDVHLEGGQGLAAAVLEGLLDGIILVNMNGEVVHVNSAFERTLGYKASELVGRSALELPTYQGPEGSQKAALLLDQVIANGFSNPVDMIAVAKDGTEVPVSFTASVIKDAKGEPRMLVAVVRDMTERMRMELALRMSEQMSRGMLAVAGTGIYILQDGCFQYVNRLFETISGYSFDELRGRRYLEIVHPGDREFVHNKAVEALKGRSYLPYQFRLLKKNGEIAWVLDRLASLDCDRERLVLGTLTDISEIKKAEAQIVEYTRQLEALFDIGITANGTLDVDDLLDRVLKKVLQVSNFEAGGIYLFDRQSNELVLKSHFGIPQRFVDRIERARATEGFTTRIALSGKPLFVPDVNLNERLLRTGIRIAGIQSFATLPIMAKEQILGIMAVASREPRQFTHSTVHLLGTICSQIALAIDNAQLYERALHLAYTDGLTGLHNRRYLLEQMEREFARAKRNGSSLSMIMMDLDGLKMINDRLGHNEGDRVLQELGRLIKGNTRASDVAARWGGDEFVVLAPDTASRPARRIAERIRAKAEQCKPISSEEATPITVSVGVATYPEHAANLTELIKHADEAMYNAKGLGKNQVCVFCRSQRQYVSARRE